MDDRSSEIREGAGLEESRINTELLDFINKYSSHFLIGLLIIVGGYAGKQWLDRAANTKINEAFAQHVDITETAAPDPRSLAALVDQYGDVRGIGAMARLREADVYLRAVATGMKPGATFLLDEATQQQTNDVAEADLPSAEERADYLNRAEALYDAVIANTQAEIGPAVHLVGAWFGKAAVAESRGDDAGAKSAYESAKAAAEAGAFPMYVALADERIASLDAGLQDVTLYAEADLPEIPEPEAPEGVDSPASILDAPIGPTLPETQPMADDGTELEFVSPETDSQPEGETDAEPEAAETEPETDPATDPATDGG